MLRRIDLEVEELDMVAEWCEVAGKCSEVEGSNGGGGGERR
jgi:hypothetical protein